MKKILLFALVLILSHSSFAQTLGFKVGTNASRVVEKNYSYNDERRLFTLWHAGILAESVDSTILNFRTGILWTQKGDFYNFDTGYGHDKTDTKVVINYIEIPLLTKVKLKKGLHANTPYFLAGPSLAMPIGKAAIDAERSLNKPEGFRENVRRDTDVVDFSLNVGIGFQVFDRIEENNSFFMEFVYNRGISKPFENQSYFENFSLSMGWNIYLKSKKKAI